MFKKLHISLNFSNLVMFNQLITVIIDMHNFVTKFGKILEICKKFAGNQVKPKGLFTRMAAKVAAFTMLQYFNLLNHRPIGQVKYALF